MSDISDPNFCKQENPLAVAPIGKLLVKFAIPSVVAMLVTGLYNIVDQIFIGNFVGELGNAATNIAFPLSTLCTATSLMFGIGGAAAFNLSMGAGKKDTAGKFVGNALIAAGSIALVITLIGEIFLTPMLKFFGATNNILPYAKEYTRITAIGFPFLIITVSGGHMIRADGKPTVSMICNLTGAIINTGLDALFVIGFGWGMKGAAAATVIGQVISCSIAVYHLAHFRTVKLTKNDWLPDMKIILRVANLGMSQGFNQIAMMVVQIVLNNSLKHYGALSIYGEDIPIAVVGISSKLAMLYFSFCIGISHAVQPIASFNYGAKNYLRTRQAYTKAIMAGSVISVLAFTIFQLFPRQIIFLLPLIVILPLIWGIDGMMFAGAIADALAFVMALSFAIREFSSPEYKK